MKSVIVIGSGVAGLTVAYYLSNAGFDVEILEATNNSGGRLTALFDSKSGEFIDNGQHALMTAYTTFLELLNDTNSLSLVNIQKSLKVDYIDTDGKSTVLNCGYLPAKAGLAFGFLLLKGIAFKSKISIIKLMQNLSSNFDLVGDMTCLEFLNKQKQGEDAIKRFWEPFIISTMNTKIENASAKILVNILLQAFVNDVSKSKLVFPNVDLSQVLKPIEKSILNHNGKLVFNTKVNNIEIYNSNVEGIHTSAGEFVKADYYVSTVQPFILKKILNNHDGSEFGYLSEFEYSPIINVYLWMDKPLILNDFVSTLGTNIQWIFNRRNLLESESEFNYKYSYSITISAADRISSHSNSEILALVYDDLRKLVSNFDRNSVLHHRIIIEKFATFQQTPITEKIRPNNKTHINNFFLAGDWTNTNLPATIEGASRSGKSTAELIINL